MPYFRTYQPSPPYHQRSQCRKYHTNSVPAWEKRFCYRELGGMPWKYFLEAKKYASQFTKIMEWDDSAGKESFHKAKNRFWARNGGPPCKATLPSPDMYIDQVDWNAKLDSQLFLDLEAARNVQVPQEYYGENACVALEVPEPTGWDVECSDWDKPVALTGMIVGEKGSYEDGKNEVLMDATVQNFNGKY